MRKLMCLVCMLFLLPNVIVVPSAFATEKIDYSGDDESAVETLVFEITGF